jgi:hypothetical protein
MVYKTRFKQRYSIDSANLPKPEPVTMNARELTPLNRFFMRNNIKEVYNVNTPDDPKYLAYVYNKESMVFTYYGNNKVVDKIVQQQGTRVMFRILNNMLHVSFRLKYLIVGVDFNVASDKFSVKDSVKEGTLEIRDDKHYLLIKYR